MPIQVKKKIGICQCLNYPKASKVIYWNISMPKLCQNKLNPKGMVWSAF